MVKTEELFKIEFLHNALVIENLKMTGQKLEISYRPDKFNEKWDKYVISELNKEKGFMII